MLPLDIVASVKSIRDVFTPYLALFYIKDWREIKLVVVRESTFGKIFSSTNFSFIFKENYPNYLSFCLSICLSLKYFDSNDQREKAGWYWFVEVNGLRLIEY